MEDELVTSIPGFDVVIAGTEPITDRVMDKARGLRLISRVGVGPETLSTRVVLAFSPLLRSLLEIGIRWQRCLG